MNKKLHYTSLTLYVLNVLILWSAVIWLVLQFRLEVIGAVLNSLQGVYVILCLTVIGCLVFFSKYRLLTMARGGGSSGTTNSKLDFYVSSGASIVLVALIAYYGPTYKAFYYGKPETLSDKLPSKAGPFLQFGPYQDNAVASTADSMNIWWIDPEGASRDLKFGLSENGLSRTIRARSSDKKRFEVNLKNLIPDRVYYYRIENFSEKTYSFRTSANNSTPFRFLTFGDTGNTKKGDGAYSYYDAVSAAANRHYRNNNLRPAFKLHLGDIPKTGIDYKNWFQFLELEAKYNGGIPFMLTVGNHEYHGDYGANTRYLFNRPLYFSFDYNNVHFLVIHPFDGIVTQIDGPFVSTGKKQYEFVKRDLARNSGKKWIVVAIHIPVLSSGDFGINRILYNQYAELFKKYKVDLVLSGHDHHFEAFHKDGKENWGGTYYIVTGTGGSRADGFIMTRKENQWKHWIHDRKSKHGLFLNHPFVKKYQLYGEISWGFTDVSFSDDTMRIKYYRWLDFPRFLEITEQKEAEKWSMVEFNKEQMDKHGLNRVTLIREFKKRRVFPGKQAGYRAD